MEVPSFIANPLSEIERGDAPRPSHFESSLYLQVLCLVFFLALPSPVDASLDVEENESPFFFFSQPYHYTLFPHLSVDDMKNSLAFASVERGSIANTFFFLSLSFGSFLRVTIDPLSLEIDNRAFVSRTCR